MEPDADDIDEYGMDRSGKYGWLVELVSTSEFAVMGAYIPCGHTMEIADLGSISPSTVEWFLGANFCHIIVQKRLLYTLLAADISRS